MTEDQKDHVLAGCLEEYHRQKALGEQPDMGAIEERLGDAFGEFQELILAETAIDQALEGPSSSSESLPRPWGPYMLLGELGRGAAGVVYEAMDRKLGRKVALKILRTGIDTDKTARTRFEREAQALAQVRHDHIVDLFEYGDVDGQPYYAMEIVDGPTLSDLIKRGEAPEPRELCAGMAGISDALRELHAAGIIHRDVKPNNIMLAPNGRYILADFGLARTAAATTVTRTGDALGTPLYMSPEQMLGNREAVEERTDVYGLGATLYHALTGQPPFQTDNLHALMRMVLTQRPEPPLSVKPDLPRDCGSIVMKCLEKERGDRYTSAAALTADLRAFAEGDRVTGKPLTRLQRARRTVVNNPAWVAAAALLVVALGAYGWLRPQDPASLFVQHSPSTAVAQVRINGGEWLPMPLQNHELEPDKAHVVEVEVPKAKGGYAPWQKTVFGEPGKVVPELVEFKILDSGHPYVVECIAKQAKVADANSISVPETHRSGSEERPLDFAFPRGPVRLEDLSQWRVYVGERFEGHGTLEFRQGEVLLAKLEFPEPDQTGKLVDDMPPAVIEAARNGERIGWGYRAADGEKVVGNASFELVQIDLAPGLQLIESVVQDIPSEEGVAKGERNERAHRIARATLRSKLYLKHELAQAAYREVESMVEVDEDTLYLLLLQKRAVELIFPKWRERRDSELWLGFHDRWSEKPADEIARFEELLEATHAAPAAEADSE